MTATHRGFSVAVLATLSAYLLLGVLAPAPARAAAEFRYWVAHPQTKVYSATLPPTSARSSSATSPAGIKFSAARGEFEGRQIAIRSAGKLTDVWLEPSELTSTDASGVVHTISADNVSTYRVHLIKVARASYGYSRTGYMPDALLPMTLANGERLGWMPSGTPSEWQRSVPATITRSFYALYRVPASAAPGRYTGTITLTARAASTGETITVAMPVSVTVHRFSIARKTLRTAFGFDLGVVKRNTERDTWLSANPDPGPGATRVAERTGYGADQVAGWLRYLSEHRISPYYLGPAWQSKAANGTIAARQNLLQDALGTGPATTQPGDRFGFDSMRLPTDSVTAYLRDPFASSAYSANATRYYRSAVAELGAYKGRAYVYPVDEPSASRLAFVRRYAAFIHRVIPGVKYLLTIDAVTAGGRLVSGVDIYVYRNYFVFRDSSYIAKIRAARKDLWLYTAKTTWQRYAPGYLLDKPFTDSRAQGWFAYRSGAKGILYYGVNHYGGRDPYVSQLQVFKRDGRSYYANGDASLIYPGYYPSLGLVVEGAPPVGSLRMEALRDGIEDYEYVKQVASRYGTSVANGYVAKVIHPVPARQPGKLQFPAYHKDEATYETVRSYMAARLNR